MTLDEFVDAFARTVQRRLTHWHVTSGQLRTTHWYCPLQYMAGDAGNIWSVFHCARELQLDPDIAEQIALAADDYDSNNGLRQRLLRAAVLSETLQ